MKRHYRKNGMKNIGVRWNLLQEIRYKQENRYAYPVMYADGTVSRMKCDGIGREPLGVILEKHLITLTDSPTKMLWNEAMAYCRSIKVLGRECNGGHIDFWKKIVDLTSNMRKRKALDSLLVGLGGEALGLEWRWSESEYYYLDAWIFSCVLSGFGLDVNLKSADYSGYYVRPVLDLSELS